MSVEIKEYYSIKPFFDPKASVERLLAGAPKEYISGLATVILRDSGSLSHDRRRAKTWWMGKKVRVQKCTGLYHEAHKGEPAWIELFIDNILMSCEDSFMFRLIFRLSLIRDFIIGETLYHELGHHIHKTIAPEYGEKEYIAERWEKRLMHDYLKSKYWYLAILSWPIRKLTKWFHFTNSKTHP